MSIKALYTADFCTWLHRGSLRALSTAGAQKDAVIDPLKERNRILSDIISDLETQSPDAFVDSLARRVDVAKNEIAELGKDSANHKDEIERKKLELDELKERLDGATNLIKDTDLVCPDGQAPLTRRHFHTIFGEVGGRKVEANIEFTEHACGYSTSGDWAEPISKCTTAA